MNVFASLPQSTQGLFNGRSAVPCGTRMPARNTAFYLVVNARVTLIGLGGVIPRLSEVFRSQDDENKK